MDVAPFPTITTPQLRHDPALDEWRATDPVRRVQLPFGRWAWMVTRYDDVKVVMTDPRFSRRAAAADDAPRKTPEVVQRGSLASMDGADHARLRRLVSRALTVRRVEAHRSHTQALVDSFLDAMDANGPEADVLRELALPVPMAVICQMLDIPYDDRDKFAVWTARHLSTTPPAEGEQSVTATAIEHLWAYLRELIAERRLQPGDDLLSGLIAARDADDALTEDELVWLAFTLLAGGYETTAQEIAKFALVLLTHRDQLDVLRARPELWPSAIDELLRLVPLGAGNALPLEALEDVELSGVTVRAGDYVITAPAAANLDPSVFADAERLDVTRADNPHFGLGHGPHYCLGANLAKMELHVALQSFFERFPTVELAVAPAEVRWNPDHAIWGVAALPVCLHGKG
jgi:cytochrome P450